MSLAEKIKGLSEKFQNEIIAIRRHLHMYPELSFKEFKTSEYIIEQLNRLGIPYKEGIAGTGIVAEIKGKEAGKIIALRADMDALPITEVEGREYGSRNKGVMHACGHDVHSACLLGAAMILNSMKDELRGTVRLIFQPGEEVLPGGASLMIRENVLKDVSCIIAQHVHPSMETGKAGFRQGMYMASTDELYLSVTGKGGHAAMPAEYINPIVPLSEFILEIDKLFMKEGNCVPSGIPHVIAFGSLKAEGATNVIPAKAFASGTFRTMNEDWRKKVHDMLTEKAKEISLKYQVECSIEIRHGYPFLVNEPSLTAKAASAATAYLGDENVEELPLRMTAEDFAWYTHEVPGCFFRLGTGNKEKGICSGVHTPSFDVDERSLKNGAGLMAFIAIELGRSFS